MSQPSAKQTKPAKTPKQNRSIPSTKTPKQIAIRFFTYGVMALATVVGVIICIGWAMGYRFDFKSGQLSQVALLQFNTFPTGASVDVNHARLSTRTPTRANIPTGQTTVSMSLQGYRSWSKTVSALPSSVRWLDYVRLVPRNVKTDSVHTFTNVDDMVASPDKKWALIVTDEIKGDFTLMDVSDPKNLQFTNVHLDDSQITDGSESKYKIIEWSTDSRFLLISHSYRQDNADHVEHLTYDRQDKKTRNLTRDFGMDLTSPHFSGTGGNVIFALTGKDLRKIDYGNKSISAPIASDVTSYVLYSNSRIAFLSQTTKNNDIKQTVSIYDDGKITNIKSYDDDKTTLIAFSRTNDVDYLAIGRGETVAVYPDPLAIQSHDPSEKSTDTAYLSSPGGMDWMEMSNNGRFVLAGKGHKVVSYDVETTENYSFETEVEGKPQWLDDYHLLDVSDGTIVMLEFDGQSVEHIVSGRLPAFLSSNSKFMFSLDNISGGVVLQRSNMTTEN